MTQYKIEILKKLTDVLEECDDYSFSHVLYELLRPKHLSCSTDSPKYLRDCSDMEIIRALKSLIAEQRRITEKSRQ